MKKLIFLFFVSSNCFAQQADTSLNARVNRMEKDMYKLTENLKSSHGEFRWGTSALILGSSLAIYGAASKAPLETKQGFVYIGSFINLLASMLMIDSHKFIGRAGRLEYDFGAMRIEFNLAKK